MKNEEVDEIKSLTKWEDDHGFTKDQKPEIEIKEPINPRKSKSRKGKK